MVILLIISGDTPQTSGEPRVVPGRGVSLGAGAAHPSQPMRGLYLALCQCAKVNFKIYDKIKFLFNAGMAKTLAQSTIYRLLIMIEEVKREIRSIYN